MEGGYGSLDLHRVMLRDDIRNRAYRQAIAEVVKPGDVVLDFGAGTGILSLFAAQAGAKRIYAIEMADIAHFARHLVTVNGYDDRIFVIQQDIQSFNLPEPVDVIVSEWLGAFGIDENMLAPLLETRDRWLKPGGAMLPRYVSAWIAPVWSQSLHEEIEFWRCRPYALDLSPIATAMEHSVAWWSEQRISTEHIVAEPKFLWSTDVYSISMERARLPFRASVRFEAQREAQVNAFIAWFRADFGNGLELTNGPDAPPTHWAQYLFPLTHTRTIEPGLAIAVELTSIPAGPGFCHHAWSARIGTGPWEHHDTRAV